MPALCLRGSLNKKTRDRSTTILGLEKLHYEIINGLPLNGFIKFLSQPCLRANSPQRQHARNDGKIQKRDAFLYRV